MTAPARKLDDSPWARSGPLPIGRDGSGPAARPAERIDAWLGMLAILTRLPRRERDEITEELGDHLHQRVRDLMLRGADEDQAVALAIEELGSAAELAAGFRSVRSNSRRRLAMNLSLFALAGTAAVLSTVAVMQPGGPSRGNVYAPPVQALADGPLSTRLDGDFGNTGIGQVFDYIGETSGMPVRVRWSTLGFGPPETMTTLSAEGATVAEVLGMVADWSEASGFGEIDYRTGGGALEIASREYFDRRETELVSYELARITDQGIDAAQVKEVLAHLVEPEGWNDNGGSLASCNVLGTKMFVSAPPRYHAKIRWILDELASGPEARAEGGAALGQAGDAGDFRRYPLRFTGAAELGDRLRTMTAGADGVRIVADDQTNSLIIGGDPEAVEAAIVSGLDTDPEAAAGGDEPVIVVIDYDGRQEVLAVDSARVMSRSEYLAARGSTGSELRLDLIHNIRRGELTLVPQVVVPLRRDIPLADPEPR